jgi:glycosyltransferase involved in cell wall biosynthesis
VPKERDEAENTRPVLAVFCYEDPDSVVGRFVTRLATALAKRQAAVHVFSRRDFDLDAAGVGCEALGDCDGEDLVDCVKEFAGRACTAFLKLFPVGCGPVTLMGFEWSAVAAVSLLRGLRKLDAVLSLHSLERQRGDVSSEISRQIEEIERAGLCEAKTTLVHHPSTANVAKTVAPECAERIAPVRETFPAHLFDLNLDPGAIKARYQVGPVDPMVVYLGDLSDRYGPDLLVKAMPAVLKNHPQTRLVVAGEGDLYWPLRVYTRYLLLEHAVRLVGSVEGQAACELIRAADVVVVPSRESTPWWPIHAAWAARRPVVASHVAAPGLLEHERDGVLCYPSENSLVWGIERVLFDADLRQALADNGAAKLYERFGWGSVAAQVEELMTVTAAR